MRADDDDRGGSEDRGQSVSPGLVANRPASREEAQKRVASQASPVQRANAADVILNSNQDLHLLLKDARKLWQQIEHEAFSGSH